MGRWGAVPNFGIALVFAAFTAMSFLGTGGTADDELANAGNAMSAGKAAGVGLVTDAGAVFFAMLGVRNLTETRYED